MKKLTMQKNGALKLDKHAVLRLKYFFVFILLFIPFITVFDPAEHLAHGSRTGTIFYLSLLLLSFFILIYQDLVILDKKKESVYFFKRILFFSLPHFTKQIPLASVSRVVLQRVHLVQEGSETEAAMKKSPGVIADRLLIYKLALEVNGRYYYLFEARGANKLEDLGRGIASFLEKDFSLEKI